MHIKSLKVVSGDLDIVFDIGRGNGEILKARGAHRDADGGWAAATTRPT